jgi:DNA repair protein SbcD/Mre11
MKREIPFLLSFEQHRGMKMREVSWMHTADLHLGKPIEHWRGTEEEYIKRKEEYRETFQRMIKIVQQRKLPFLFIAGDFLEHGYVSRSLLDFVLEQFARIPETEVWIAPGNHDPYRGDSVYAKETWPDHVHIFGGKWETHTYREYDLQIVGKGFADFHEKQWSRPTLADSERKIMVVHGDLVTKRKKSDYFPIWQEALVDLELDYVALGHIHQAFSRVLDNERQTLLRYPGSPEALSWKETQARTCTIGQITHDPCEIEIEPIHTKTYEQHTVELLGFDTKEKALAKLLQQLEAYDRDGYHLLRLQGRVSPDWRFAEDIPWLIMQLQENGFQHVYVENQLLPDFDLDSLKRKSFVLARFIQMMEDKMMTADKAERHKIHIALYKGLEAIWQKGLSS